MINKNSVLSIALFTLATTSQLAIATFVPNIAKADTLAANSSEMVINFKPKGDKQPINTAGGASRGVATAAATICNGDSQVVKTKVTTLLPKNNYGLTVQGKPTLLVYVPKSSATKAFFSVQDDQGNDHYDQILNLPSQDGIMKINLKNAPELATGKTYKWSFVVMCAGKMLPDSPVVEGYIKRVEANSNIKNIINSDNKLAQVQTYAQEGIWYETVAELAELRANQPNDQKLTASWEKLLTDVGLSNINQEKIMK
jgi:Domain of Unknown Function (DUF928)